MQYSVNNAIIIEEGDVMKFRLSAFGFGVFTALLVFSSALSLHGLEVDVDELETTVTDTVSFINYSGPHDDIDTIEEIRGIGVSLSREIASGESREFAGKYRITHVLPEEGQTLRGADVLELLDDARVDHIDNLRRIISAYLESRYAYSSEDANLLGRLVTVYNAVHRGNMELFSSRYIPELTTVLDPEKAGLSLSYTEWAGASQIIIPIAPDAAPGELSSVPADELMDESVEETIRDSEDRGLEERMETADLIDRTVDEETSQIEEEETAIQEEQEAIQEEEQELQQQEQELEEEIQELDRQIEESEPESEEREELEQQREEAEQQQEDVSRQREELDERRQETEERQAQTDQRREQTDEAEERSREIREEAAQDVEELSTSREEPVSELRVTRSRIANNVLYSTLLIINSNDGAVLTTAQREIIGRQYLETRQGIIAISKEDGSPGLVLLDPDDLSFISAGDSEVSPYSPLLTGSGDGIFAVIRDGGEWYAGRFDANLNLLFRSSIPVSEASNLVIENGKLIVQRKDGRFTGLDLDELSVNP